MVYGSGTTVVLLDLENTSTCDAFCGHMAEVTAVRLAPGGTQGASGDAQGTLMLWATAALQNAHITKQVLTGAIKDVAWSPDETCIALCGSSVGLRACVISAKTGDTISDLPGHTRTVLSLDFSPKLPYRIITASEGFSVNLYTGDPLCLVTSNKVHTNYAQCTRFSPDGTRYVSVSSDRTIVLFDAASCSAIRAVEQGELGHFGSIMSVAWLNDGERFATCSLDRMVKVWTEAGCVQTLSIAEEGVSGHQCAVAPFQSDGCISVSLSGTINIWDSTASSVPQPLHVVGHQNPVTAIDVAEGTILTGDTTGQIICRRNVLEAARFVYRPSPVVAIKVQPQGQGFAVVFGIRLICLFTLDSNQPAFDYITGTAPICAAWDSEWLRVLCTGGAVESINFQQQLSKQQAPDGAIVLCAGQSGDLIFGTQAGSLHIGEEILTEHSTEITALAVTQSKALLVSGDTTGRTILWNLGQRIVIASLSYGTACVTSIDWSWSEKHFVCAASDGSITLYNSDGSSQNSTQAHKGRTLQVRYITENTLASSGDDHLVKIWSITNPST